METIGSRLRKRRRTDSSPTGESPPAPKRASSRKIAAPSKHGQATPSTSNTGSHQEPTCTSNSDRPDEQSREEMGQAKNNAHQITSNSTPHRQEIAAQGPGAADFKDVVSNGETVDNHHAYQGNDTVNMVDTESFSQLGAGLHLKTQSLPILDNLVSRPLP